MYFLIDIIITIISNTQYVINSHLYVSNIFNYFTKPNNNYIHFKLINNRYKIINYKILLMTLFKIEQHNKTIL